MNKSAEITRFLNSLQDSGENAPEELAISVYEELRKIARFYMRDERKSHTLQPTALVAEAYLRLFHNQPVNWDSRGHFYRVAAAVMRHVLVDHARKRDAKKRGAGARHQSLQEGLQENLTTPDELDEAMTTETDLVALDEALHRLAKIDSRLGQVVELRYFGGLDVEQTAAALNCSTGTVKRDWKKAKMWLKREMRK